MWIKKFAPLPSLPHCVDSDRRVKFDNHAANRIWNLLERLEESFRSEIFMYLASTTEKTSFHRGSIVSKVSRYYPRVVWPNLHLVKDVETDLGRELLAYYRPESGTTGRKDVDEHHQLVEDTIRVWVKNVQDKETTAWRDLPVYIIRGASSLPNILTLEPFGKKGKCKIKSSSIDIQTTGQPLSIFPFPYREVLERGILIQKDLTDQEHAERNTALYDDVFHVVSER